MLKVTLRSLQAHKLRLVATAVAVALGVGFTTGTLVLTDTISRTFDRVFDEIGDGIDVVVRQPASLETRFGNQRTRLPQRHLATVVGTPGVAFASGTVEGFAQVIGSDGAPVGTSGRIRRTLGQNWQDVPRLNPWRLTDGRPPNGVGEVVLDRRTASDAGLGIGDPVTVLLPGPPRTFTVVGLARFGSVDRPAGSTMALFETATAQTLIGQTSELDSIVVNADPGTSDTELAERLRQGLPPEVEVLTAAEFRRDQNAELDRSLAFFGALLGLFAGIALFVGGFIIYNTFTIVVAQRRRELALLRCLGGRPRQLLGAVLLEAAIVGALASAVGLVSGLLLAEVLERLLDRLGFAVPAEGLVLSPRTVIGGLAVGIGVTLLSALIPAWRGAGIAPMAALREVETEPDHLSGGRVVLGLVLAVASAAALVVGAGGNGGRPLLVVGVGAGLALISVAVLGPGLIPPLSRLVGHPVTGWIIVIAGIGVAVTALFVAVASLADRYYGGLVLSAAIALMAAVLVPAGRASFGIGGRIGRENAVRHPRRAASTAGALTIGVAVVASFLIVADSVKASIDDAVDSSFLGDFVIDPGPDARTGFEADLAIRIAALPEVAAASGLRYNLARVADQTTSLPSVDTRAIPQVFDLDVVEGSLADLDSGSIAVGRTRAAADEWSVGSRVPIEFATTGPQLLRVGAVYTDDQLAGDVLVDHAVFERNFADQNDLRVFVALAPGVPRFTGRSAIQPVIRAYPSARILDVDQFKEAQADQVDQLLGLVIALLVLAIVIAVIGIANTLGLSVFERTREFGLLRAVGMTPEQLRSSVRWESVVIALIGTVVGVAIGTAFGWGIMRALADDGLRAVRIPVGQLAAAVLVGAVVGVIASALPARRAGKVEILDAVEIG